MPLIPYNTDGDPVEVGVYACRTPLGDCPGLTEDKFLMWFEGKWFYLKSDQQHRGAVLGWIGPLQRRLDFNFL